MLVCPFISLSFMYKLDNKYLNNSFCHTFLHFCVGNARDLVFSNIKISTRYYDPLWWGRAEPIYITSCPRFSTSKSGSISNLRFENISAVSENGVFLSGTNHGLLHNITFKNVNLTYKRWTEYPGGLFDYRPDCQGLVKHNTAGLMVEHVSGLDLQNVKMSWYKSSLISGWGTPLYFRPNTVDKIYFHEWQSEKSLDIWGYLFLLFCKFHFFILCINYSRSRREL